VAGYRLWQSKGRFVNKGEKGIRILAPSSFKVRKSVPKLDECGKPAVGADGQTQTEKKVVTVQTYTLVSVFDVSQTSGEPLPEIAKELQGNSSEVEILLQSVEAACSQPIEYHSAEKDPVISGGAHGYFNHNTGLIVIDKDASLDQKAKTLIHEWAHQRLHSRTDGKPREQREIEAEATAYVCSKHFGLDTSDYSFDYIASYAVSKNGKELKEILDGIKDNTREMIDSIAESYTAIQKEETGRDTESGGMGKAGIDEILSRVGQVSSGSDRQKSFSSPTEEQLAV
jgi:hypothetical protein